MKQMKYKKVQDTQYDSDYEDNNIRNMSLGDRMKYYEKQSEDTKLIKPYQSYIVRLDGKNFSTHTSTLSKPFDDIFTETMLKTAKDLLMEFHGSTVFVQSDEINIVFKAVCTKNDYDAKLNRSEHIFGGRVWKILSILAGFTSSRFTLNFTELLKDSMMNNINENIRNKHEKYLKRLSKDNDGKFPYSHAKFCFDSRITLIPLDRPFEIVNNLLWRSVHDGYRNFVSGLAYHYFSNKKLKNMKTTERAELLRTEKNIDVDKEPCHYRYGWFLKLMKMEKVSENGNSYRNIPVAKSLKLHYSPEIEKMIYCKYWDDVSNEIKFEEVKMFYSEL